MKKPISAESVFQSGGPAPGELVTAAFRLWLQERLGGPAAALPKRRETKP